MKIQYKLSLIYVPVLVMCIAGTGFIAYFIALNALKDQEIGALSTITKTVVQDEITNRIALLEESSLADVPSFVAAYKEEVFGVFIQLATVTNRHFHVVETSSKKVIFTTQNPDSYDDSNLFFLDNKIQLNAAVGEFGSGYEAHSGLYASINISQWDWTVYVTQDAILLTRKLQSIAIAVVLVVIVACLLAYALLHIAGHHLLMRRIQSLTSATNKIAESSAAVTLNDNSSDEIGVLARDIETMSSKLAQSIDEIKQASRAKSQFLAVMSHEIRTPLNGISGLAKLLSLSELNDKQAKFANDLVKSAESLNKIMTDVLDFSKIEAGKMELESVPFNAEEMVVNVAEVFDVAARSRNTSLHTKINNLHDIALIGDPVKTRQILTNLVSNAVKFTKSGAIHVIATYEAPHLYLTVADSGIGIAPDNLETIFELFTQSDSSITRKFGGTGLGLAITKKLVDMMSGSIEVSSKIDQGTRFVVKLPLGTTQPLPTTNQNLAFNQFEANVLVVEDDEINAVVAQELLSQFGVTIDVAKNGKIACDMAATSQYDMIFMDIHMPEMDGIEATKTIRNADFPSSKIPIVGLTAEALQSRHAVFRRAGMNNVITKPISAKSLQEQLIQHLSPEAALG